MPGGDGTGPIGAGPATGRGAGRCAGYPVAGWANRGAWGFRGGRGGRGAGFGGGGRGWRHRFRQTVMPGWMAAGPWPDETVPEEIPQLTAKAERTQLRRRARALERQLSALRQRLDELEAEQPADEPEAG